jgi:hypothetical protein
MVFGIISGIIMFELIPVGEPVFFLARDPLILSEGFSFSAGEIFSG